MKTFLCTIKWTAVRSKRMNLRNFKHPDKNASFCNIPREVFFKSFYIKKCKRL